MESESQVDMHLALIQRQFKQNSKRHGIDLTCSIGAAIYPFDGESVKQLMSSAKYALAQAKITKNTIRYHDKELAKHELQRQTDDFRLT